MKEIRMMFDGETLRRYEKYYFEKYPKRKKKPIAQPCHESINVWMIMKRPMMNVLKQRWKEFMVWFVEDQGYANLRIAQCEMSFTVYYGNNRRHDVDNTTPKFVIDGMVQAGLVEDDDSGHIRALTLRCGTDTEHPRTEISIKIIE